MAAVAILIANSEYSGLSPLPCCREDAQAVEGLLGGTGRFDAIHQIIDRDATALKRELRSLLEPLAGVDELFFYYSGHGLSEDGEFYFCPRDFNPRRPNETGLSHSELIALAREVSPALLVQVVDACQSGARMIKSGGPFIPELKAGLRKVVQIAACAESETALAGEQLSPFTERFCRAAARDVVGPTYYMDIIATLRDAYLPDTERSPFFVLQASARETFIDDPGTLAPFRAEFERRWGEPTPVTSEDLPADEIQPPVTLADQLAALEAKLAREGEVQPFINTLFDGLSERLSQETFDDCFDLATATHSDFQESATQEFVIRVLSQEKRADAFVTASIEKERRRRRNAYASYAALALGYGDDYEEIQHFDLSLNMHLERAQLRITLTPRFSSLRRIVLVVTCAPSLEHCYIFELAIAQQRTDWNSFASEGTQLTRRWYRTPWHDDLTDLRTKIAEKLVEEAHDLVTSAAQRLSRDD